MEEIQRESMDYDVVVVGAGPSGLSAATAISYYSVSAAATTDTITCIIGFITTYRCCFTRSQLQ